LGFYQKTIQRERKKIRWTDLGLVKKEKQLDERKLCSFFAKPQKQIRPFYFSSNTKVGICWGFCSGYSPD
jgi:hypothetical protein